MVRKVVARVCFWALKAARAAFWDLEGVLDGDLGGETDGETLSSSSSRGWSSLLGTVFGVFLGEYSSFQSFITSWLQKASMLGR